MTFAKLAEEVEDLRTLNACILEGTRRFGLDARIVDVVEKYGAQAEYGIAFQELTPEKMGKMIGDFAAPLPNLGDITELEVFRDFGWEIGDRFSGETGAMMFYRQESDIMLKIRTGDTSYTQEEVDIIKYLPNAALQQELRAKANWNYIVRLFHANMEVFKDLGCDTEDIGSILKASMSMIDRQHYWDVMPSPFGVLEYHVIMQDVIRNMNEAGLAARVKPVLRAVETIAKHDMSLLTSFYGILDKQVGETGKVVAEDDALLKLITYKIASYNWLINHRARLKDSYGTMSDFDRFMRGDWMHIVTPEPTFTTVLLNRYTGNSPMNLALALVPQVAEYGLDNVEELFDLVQERLADKNAEQMTGSREHMPITQITYSRLKHEQYESLNTFFQYVPVLAKNGVSFRKFLEIQEAVDEIYLRNEYFAQFFRQDIPDLVALINSDADKEVKAKILESYFVDKRISGKVNLPADYTAEVIARYKPAAKATRKRYEAFVDLIIREVSFSDGNQIAKQITQISESGLDLCAVQRFIKGAQYLGMGNFFLEDIIGFAPVIRRIETIQKARSKKDKEEEVDKAIYDVLKLTHEQVQTGEITEPAVQEISKQLPDTVAAKFRLSEQEAAQLYRRYTTKDMMIIADMDINNDKEAQAIGDLVRRDLGLLPQTKGLPLGSFPLGKIYYAVEAVPARNLDGVSLLRFISTLLLTREPERAREAQQHFREEQALEARAYAQRFHVVPNAVYQSIEQPLSRLDALLEIGAPVPGSSHAREVTQAAKKVIDQLQGIYIDKINPQNTNHALQDLLSGARILLDDPTGYQTLIFKVQDGTVLDLSADDDSILSCAFKNSDNGNCLGGTLYGIEDEIGLLHIVPQRDNEIFDPIGAAIAVNCVAPDESSWLAVDTLEGGEQLNRVRERLWQAYALQSLYEMARDMNHDFMIVNTALVNPNDIPGQFAAYVRGTSLPKQQVALSMRGTPKILQYGFEKHLLDMFCTNGKSVFNLPQGVVTGRVVDLSKDYNFVNGAEYAGRAVGAR